MHMNEPAQDAPTTAPLCAYCEDATATESVVLNHHMTALCSDCLHDHVSECDRCGLTLWSKDAHVYLGQVLDLDCFQRLVTPEPEKECPF